jgi:hypothetical protein
VVQAGQTGAERRRRLTDSLRRRELLRSLPVLSTLDPAAESRREPVNAAPGSTFLPPEPFVRGADGNKKGRDRGMAGTRRAADAGASASVKPKKVST